MHKTVDNVRYAIGRLYSGGGGKLEANDVHQNTNLDTGLDDS